MKKCIGILAVCLMCLSSAVGADGPGIVVYPSVVMTPISILLTGEFAPSPVPTSASWVCTRVVGGVLVSTSGVIALKTKVVDGTTVQDSKWITETIPLSAGDNLVSILACDSGGHVASTLMLVRPGATPVAVVQTARLVRPAMAAK